jgi:hypothetical protein
MMNTLSSMKYALILLFKTLLASNLQNTVGNGIYFYPKAEIIAAAVTNLTAFNNLPNSAKIKQIYMYGAYSSYSPNEGYTMPFSTTYFAALSKIPGASIQPILEGDPSLLTAPNPENYANLVAKVFCPLDVAGDFGN